MKKIMFAILMGMVVFSLVGCKNSTKDNNVVNISILNSKPEMEEALATAIDEFTKQNSDIQIKIVKYSKSSTYSDKLESMYAIENPPTMMLVDPNYITLLEGKLADLSSEEWNNSLAIELSELAYNQEKEVVAFPFTIEGIGLIYNKSIIKEAGIDIDNIRTQQELEEAFKKVEAIGKKAIVITNEAWSLGDHFLSTGYSVHGKEGAITEYFNSLRQGTVDVSSDSALNGVLDTFDLMKQYNMFASAPLSPSYDKCAEVMGKGEAAFWYMGNWAYEDIAANSSGEIELGMIPLPISDNASDYGNTQIVTGVTKYITIDQAYSSKEQQDAAKRFVNWLVTREEGRYFMTEGAQVIPAFNNMELTNPNSLVQDIMNYQNEDKTMELMNSYLPKGNSDIVGNGLRKYLNGEIEREDLFEIISDFWKG